jgi:DNA-directed RNA polymerase specialized sigma24 family protein
MIQPTDQELIGQLQSGSLEALGTLYDRYRAMVFRTALAITGDREAASDLLQDVFMRLYRFANHFDSQRMLEPWLYRMTANLSYSWVKRNRHFLPHWMIWQIVLRLPVRLPLMSKSNVMMNGMMYSEPSLHYRCSNEWWWCCIT